MSSNLPIPLPPRTPTPPTPIPANSPPQSPEATLKARPSGYGLGLHQDNTSTPSIHTDYDYDIHTGINDSPERRQDGGPLLGVDRGLDSGRAESTASMLSPNSAVFNDGGRSPASTLYSPITPQTGNLDGGFGGIDGAGAVDNPFNFQTVQYERRVTPRASNEALGKRRGHKYRHSSIHASHVMMDSIFKPPPSQRAPLSLPASLPMPTRKEAWWSMTRQQTVRLWWCACHFLIAGYVQFSGAGSLAMTALSRLLLFDAAGATVCVVVDVMGNFEVWKRSSIKHPFGLERADVLAGFGMAVFIAFMGLDVISHGIQHALENVGHHEAHSPHNHERVGAGHVDASSILSIASTLVSAVLLKNHARIGKAIRFELLAGWGRVLGNPSHFLTISCSLLILLLPFLTTKHYGIFDKILAFSTGGLMIALGVRLALSLSSILLMSVRPPTKDKNALREVIYEIATSDPAVTNVDEARFWQVHYGLCMANLKLRYRSSKGGYGMTDDYTRIRQNVADLVKKRLGGVRWDVSVQLSVETY